MSNAKLYQAINEDSYKKLAAFMADTEYKVTLFPKSIAIVMGEDAEKEAGEFIDELGLDFHISPMSVYAENYCDAIDCPFTDAETLREIIYKMQEQKAADANKNAEVIADLKEQCEEVRKDSENRYKNWQREIRRNVQLRNRIRAITVLLNDTYPVD